MIKYLLIIILLLFGTLTKTQGQLGLLSSSEGSYDGLTLFSPINFKSTYLLDNCGNVLHEWTADQEVAMMAYLMEDGRLVRTGRLPNDFNAGGSGGRIEIYNWEGDLLWRYDVSSETEQQHHDVSILPNGNILVLAWDLYENEEAIEQGRDPETLGNGGIWSEKILELKPIGNNDAEIVWEWKVWDHLVQDFDSTKSNFGSVAESPNKIDINYLANGLTANDWLHCNSVDYNESLDQIMLSSLNFKEVWIISHDTLHSSGGDILYRWGNPAAYDRGDESDQKLFNQHDAHWIKEGLQGAGNILVFNNGIGRISDDFYSDIVEIESQVNNTGDYSISQNEPYGPSNPIWTYPRQPDPGFFSNRISGAQRLPNGNTLICNGRMGYIFEVTLEEEIVWEYTNPVNGAGPNEQGNNIFGNDVFRVNRLPRNYPAFLNRILNPGSPLELNPIPNDCNTIISNNENILQIPQIDIYPNPTSNELVVEGKFESYNLSIHDLNGIIQFSTEVKNGDKVDLAHLNSGLYVITLTNNLNAVILKKLITKV